MSGSSATRRRAPKRATVRSTTARSLTRRKLHGHRTTPFVGLLALVAVLCLGGLVMVLSASSVAALDQLGDSYYFFKRQLVWLLIGTVAMVATMRLDYRTWRRFALPAVIIAIIALLLVLVPQIGISVNGSRAVARRRTVRDSSPPNWPSWPFCCSAPICSPAAAPEWPRPISPSGRCWRSPPC